MDAQFPGIDLWHKIGAKARDQAHFVDRARRHVQKSGRFLSRYRHPSNAAYFLLKLRKFRVMLVGFATIMACMKSAHSEWWMPMQPRVGPPQWMKRLVLVSLAKESHTLLIG